MEFKHDPAQLLDMMIRPAFSVEGGVITHINHAAAGYMVATGTPIAALIKTGAEEYAALSGGCLCLTLSIQDVPCDASVTRTDGADIFVLETDQQGELQALALAAKALREPLSGIMSVTDQLLPTLRKSSDPAARQQAAQISRRLHQLLRLVNNMSDAARYSAQALSRLELLDICAVLDEVFEKAAALAEYAGITVRYHGLRESVICPVDTEKLERAVYNILSNAMTFSGAGSTIDARLIRHGNRLHLTVHDSGSGIDPAFRSSVFSRYLRQPSQEDSRFGIGLGMVMVRSAAAAHGGAVLIEQPDSTGTRITITLSAAKNGTWELRSPRLKVDYAGERDHALIELSGNLPLEAYEV